MRCLSAPPDPDCFLHFRLLNYSLYISLVLWVSVINKEICLRFKNTAGSHGKDYCIHFNFATWCPPTLSRYHNFYSPWSMGFWVITFCSIFQCCSLQGKQKCTEKYKRSRVLPGKLPDVSSSYLLLGSNDGGNTLPL